MAHVRFHSRSGPVSFRTRGSRSKRSGSRRKLSPAAKYVKAHIGKYLKQGMSAKAAFKKVMADYRRGGAPVRQSEVVRQPSRLARSMSKSKPKGRRTGKRRSGPRRSKKTGRFIKSGGRKSKKSSKRSKGKKSSKGSKGKKGSRSRRSRRHSRRY